MNTCHVTYSHNPNYLFATIRGERTRDTIADVAREVVAKCMELGSARLLADIRDLRGSVNIYDVIHLLREVIPDLRGSGVLEKVSVIDLSKHDTVSRTFNELAFSEGVKVRVFSSHTDAISWLLDEYAT